MASRSTTALCWLKVSSFVCLLIAPLMHKPSGAPILDPVVRLIQAFRRLNGRARPATILLGLNTREGQR